LNVVIFGPLMENRRLPDWALQPIESGSLTAVELLVRRTSIEIYGRSEITIVGPPWVNPRGRGKATVCVGDYLNDPLSLYRSLEVAFKAPRSNYCADVAMVVADAVLKDQLESARKWVTLRLSGSIPDERVFWWVFEPSLNTLFAEGTIGEAGDDPLPLVGSHPLPSGILGIAGFCTALGSILQ